MNREIRIAAMGLMAAIVTLLLAACASRTQSESNGTAWGTGAFRSNGERILFHRHERARHGNHYTSGPASSGWMMMGNGRLACASCHGPDGRGGVHNMGMMQSMDARTFAGQSCRMNSIPKSSAWRVTKGQDPDGTQLKTDMPRWNIGDDRPGRLDRLPQDITLNCFSFSSAAGRR